MAISIALGQIGKIFGFTITKEGIIPRLTEFVSKISLTNLPTLAIGLVAFIVLVVSPMLIRRLPAALAAMIVTGSAVKILGLTAVGVKTIGAVPAGLPHLKIPSFPLEYLPDLSAAAAASPYRFFEYDAYRTQLRGQESV